MLANNIATMNKSVEWTVSPSGFGMGVVVCLQQHLEPTTDAAPYQTR